MSIDSIGGEPLLVADSGCELGEGPLWDAGRGRLFWFDIQGSALLSLRHGDVGVLTTLPLPFRASAACLTRDGALMTATERGLWLIDPDGGRITPAEAMDLGDGFRSNDGKIDPAGAFWWSSMDDDHGRRPGKVYRARPGRPSEVVFDGVHITNALSFSPDGRRGYVADSLQGRIDQFDLAADGALGPRRPFATLDIGDPDGSATDAAGYVWNAQWGAWRIVRYAPDGRIDRVVPMPVAQPSCCAFGGEDLRTLYITSAKENLPQAERDAQPLAGGVFAIKVDTPGLALPAFGERSALSAV